MVINYDYYCTFPAIYLTVVIIVCGCSLVCTAIVMNVYLRDPPVPMSPLMRRIVFGIVGRLVCYKPQNRVEPESSGVKKSHTDLMTTDHDMECDKKSINYIQNDISSNQDGTLLQKISKDYIQNDINSNQDGTLLEKKSKDYIQNDIISNQDGSLLTEIKRLIQKIEDDQEEENLKYEWKEAGKVLDRIFLNIFGIATFLTLTVLFVGR